MAEKQAISTGLSWGGRLFFGSLSAGTFGLGVWQTQRYFEKQGLIAQREWALEQAPSSGFYMDEQQTYRRMRLTGRYFYELECLVGPRSPPPGVFPNRPGYSSGGMARGPQGYYVLTPLILESTSNVETTKEDKNSSPPPFVVWVNRGWVPLFMVVKDDDMRKHGKNGESSAPPKMPQVHPVWDRPNERNGSSGLVTVTVVSTQPEKPRFLVADHIWNVNPPRLFWFDWAMLRDWLHAKSSSFSPEGKAPQVLALVTAVQDGDGTELEFKLSSFPVKPLTKNVGEFKTTPMVHAGYALTWYGLAISGVYMTRKMILRR